MNRKTIYIIAVILVLIGGLVLLGWLHTRQMAAVRKNAKQAIDEKNSSSVAPTSSTLSPENTENVRKGLKTVFDGLKQLGAKEVPPIADELKVAVESGDSGNMLRAFNEAIYGRYAKMSESIPAIKFYLESPEPYVRYLAAEVLLHVGDQSGVDTLLRIVQQNEVVNENGRDLRFSAATALAAFGSDKAADSIRDLYSKTKKGDALDSLVVLGVEASESNSWLYIPSRLAIESYAKVGSKKFLPQITQTFNQSNDPATKNTAAWALTRLTGNDKYMDYLTEKARPAIEASAGESISYNENTTALKYLGSIQSLLSVHVLEEALDSQNQAAVSYATVNLLFNQSGDSEKAKQVLIDQFEGKRRSLDWVLAMQIASKLDDPKVKAAAKAFDQRTGGEQWRYWGVERADWPIENWVYDYVVVLNK